MTQGHRRPATAAAEDPREEVHRELNLVTTGYSSAALVVGRGGTGKTHLLRGQAQLARELSVPVVEIRGVRGADDVWLPPSPGAGAASPAPGRDAVAMIESIATALPDGGVVLVDDAHWLTDEALGALCSATRLLRPDGPRMVVTTRPDGHRAGTQLLIDALANIAAPTHLARYPDRAAETLLRSCSNRLASGLGDTFLLATERVPALLHELIGLIDREPAHIERWVAQGSCPRSIVSWVRPRVDRLSTPARRALALHTFAISAPDDIGPLVTTAEHTISYADALEELEAEGLLSETGNDLIPLVSQACLEILGPAERTSLHLAIAETLRDRGAPATQWAPHLQMGQAPTAQVSEACLAAVDETMRHAPLSALSWLDDAEASGATSDQLAARRVEAFVRSGQPVEAIRAAEPISRSTDPAHLLARMHLSVSYLHARMPQQAAQVMLQLRDDVDHEPSAALAQVAAGLFQLDAGRIDAARQLIEGQRERAPADLTLGLACDVGDSVLQAVLTNRIDEAVRRAVVATDLEMTAHAAHELPTSAATIATMLSLIAFDFGCASQVARRVLDEPAASRTQRQRRALRSELVAVMAGTKAPHQRSGQLPEAPSDRMLAVAAAAGSARRSNDLTRLRQLQNAMFDVLRQPPDLVFLPAYAEVLIAAARLGAMEKVSLARSALGRLLVELDPRYTTGAYLAWIDFQCSIVSEMPFDVDAFQTRVDGLDVVGHQRTVVDVMAVWCALASGRAGPPEVIAAADQLHALSMAAEATRFVGAAAARFADDASARTLLGYARSRRRGPVVNAAPEAALTAALSPREREVAILIVEGLRYKEIGARLYISPKTVEHHVARIRQRIGVDNRADMLAVLRAELGGPANKGQTS